jgi:hypothetical protein
MYSILVPQCNGTPPAGADIQGASAAAVQAPVQGDAGPGAQLTGMRGTRSASSSPMADST